MLLFPPGSLPNGPHLETKKALMLLDFQNDFVSSSGGLYADNIKAFLPRLPDLVSRFREKGEVVWSRTIFREPRPTLSPDTGGYVVLLKQFANSLLDQRRKDTKSATSGDASTNTSSDYSDLPVGPDAEAFLAQVLPSDCSRCCVRDTLGAELPTVLSRAFDPQRDIMVTKSDYSAFADMSLVLQLRTRMVTDLYVCGSLSNISVYATVLDAVRHGFGVTVIEDCIGYRDDACHISAMRQMADNMCAEGTDYQELMDDLSGLLGDVIKEESFATRFQVELSRSAPTSRKGSSPQTTTEWAGSAQRPHQKRVEHKGSTPTNRQHPAQPNASAQPDCDSSQTRGTRDRSATIESSPPRKRSTNDLEDDIEEFQPPVQPPVSAYRRQSHDSYSRSELRGKKPKVRVRRPTKDPSDATLRRDHSTASHSSPSRNGTASGISSQPSSPTAERNPRSAMASPAELQRQPKSPAYHSTYPNKRLSKKASQMVLGPNDNIGDGTSSVIYNILSEPSAKDCFEKLRTNVQWQKMYHRSGEVPRLVAVQGTVTSNTSNSTVIGAFKKEGGLNRTTTTTMTTTYPIYRHPSDESPILLPFDETVDMLRRECEKHVGHPLNHVLIQHYRNSEDNISEHSDKTLDIVRGSNIVNLSLGARRTMTLRTKKVDLPLPDDNNSTSPAQRDISAGARITQRVPLPNASLFILSNSTNAKWLHSIRADKRPPSEKTDEELAFGCERISLTFRHIGTFITDVDTETIADTGNTQQSQSQRQRTVKQLIWGQGARNKTEEDAGLVLQPSNLQVNISKQDSNTASDINNNDNNNSNITSTMTKEAKNNNGVPSHDQDNRTSTDPDTTASTTNNHQPPALTNPTHEPEETKAESSEADIQAEEMIIGFGRENHESSTFDWDVVYGRGFDVVNFVTKS